MSKAKLACKCKSISDSVLGDGCDICNPEKAKDVAYERIADLEQQLSTLQERYDALDRFTEGRILEQAAELSTLREALDLIINMDNQMFTLGDACSVALDAVAKARKEQDNE